MKKLHLFALVALALLLAACSDYTDVIPADATMLGRGNLEAFQEQTGIDLSKLLSDITEALQESDDDFPEMDAIMANIDLAAPVYWFAAGDMAKSPFLGGVVKVGNSEDLVDAIDKALLSNDDITRSDLKKIKKDEDGIIVYQPRNEHIVLGISKEALLVLVGPQSSDRKVRDKALSLLNGEEKGIKDNELYEIMDDHDAFASVYVSMAIVPDAAWKRLSDEFKRDGIRLSTSQLKTMMFGLDATVSRPVLDFNFWYKSGDANVQAKLDELLASFQVPTDDGFQAFTSDVWGGMVLNLNGAALVDVLPDICSTLGTDIGDIPSFNRITAMLKALDGNMLIGITDTNKAFAVAQTSDIHDMLVQQFAPEYVGHEGYSQDDFDYYDRPYYNLKKNGTEYIKVYSWSSPDFFGYKDGFSYFAEYDIAGNVLGEDVDMQSSLKKALMSNRVTLFISMQALLNQAFSRRERETVEEACSEFFDNVEFLTFSL